MNESKRNLWLAAGALMLAIGIALGGYFVSLTLYKSRVAINTADVKGLAERRVEADQAFWTIRYTVSGSQNSDVASLYKSSELDQQKIVSLLENSGFAANEISIGIINYSKKEYRDENQQLVDEKHYLTGSIEVQTEKVHLVSKVRSKLNSLVAQGVNVVNNAPDYRFTKLNEIKPAMLKEATMNARIAANEFATNAGVKVGGIRSARQGGFIIRDVGSNYGDTKKIQKEVRVVTNVTFFLVD